MTDIERSRSAGADEDRLPWLEPAENEQPAPGVGAGRLIAAVLVALVAIGLVIGGLFWIRDRGARVDGGNGDLIAAPAGDYKVAPTDPGGMNVEGEGDATYAASQGVPVDAAIDISRRPEAPMAVPARAPTPATPPAAPPAAPAAPPVVTAAAPVRVPAVPVAVPPKPAETVKAADVPPAATKPVRGPSVQLGALGSEAKAQAAWSDLAGRFPSLAAFPHSVTLAEVGGKKLYRLRASAGDRGKAGTVCRALTSAKEACAVIN
ncbi:SPOR domain-containing protein [Sphingomonas solaris]|uniref:SPOR domain-containing protein n=1 Tax=Alterirhizorhabdus solaris TaxID=2529389 RepID=A0A558QTG2_9SPHN|nr:SPOR domain-containing protein [Sphingomonas solaris]TVV70347.1 SPOR domain-containing protein [Sphingomonas solaris]